MHGLLLVSSFDVEFLLFRLHPVSLASIDVSYGFFFVFSLERRAGRNKCVSRRLRREQQGPRVQWLL